MVAFFVVAALSMVVLAIETKERSLESLADDTAG
jgi:hypothetical protein